MKTPAEIIASYPGLGDYLAGGSWESRFSPLTRNRSRGYANERFITRIRHDEAFGIHLVVFSAEVRSSATTSYQNSIYFRILDSEWVFESDCSCPVGTCCKHSCAFLKILARSASTPEIHQEPQLDFATSSWLRQLEIAASHKPAAPAKKAAAYHKFLAYCIDIPEFDPSNPKLVLRVASRTKDGSIILESSQPTADITNPPKYMSEADIYLVSRFRRIEHKQHGYYGIKLHGPGVAELLQDALVENRLFYTHPSRGRGQHDISAITAGPPEAIVAGWQAERDGSTRPVLEFSSETLLLLHTEPPCYLDPSNCLLGPVESDLSPALLKAWERGPTIKPTKIPLLLEKLSNLTDKPLPSPTELRSETRPAHPPEPSLLITREKVGADFDAPRVLLGLPTFRYGDSPPLPPLGSKASPFFSKISGSTRVTWPRDARQEARHLQTLLQSGFIALSDITPSQHLNPLTRLAVTLPSGLRETELDWIDFLQGPQAAAIRAAGWTIDVPPSTGLVARDAGEFFSAIEADPDHGIDWFRFDMQFEIDGRKLSLIPIIARIIREGFPPSDSENLPEHIAVPCENPQDGFIRFPAKRLLEIVEQVCHLFHGNETGDSEIRLDRIAAASVADSLGIDSSETTRALAKLGHNLKNIRSLPLAEVPVNLRAELRPYQLEGYRWLQFLAEHQLHGILADDMGLGKTVQTLAHLAAECAKKPGKPSLVIAPTSVVPNWAEEAAKFTPHLKILTLQGKDRAENFDGISQADIVLTSYPLITRDLETFESQDWHAIVLDEAQYIKNPKAITAQNACKLRATQRLCLSGTPMENHLGELWSLLRFLMPGFLGDEKSFNTRMRKPIERDHSSDAQLALNRRVSPLILRRTKDQVATDLPEKTTLVHHVELTKIQTDLYESVRASMDKRVRDAIAAKGLAKSHIIVLDALLKLRQICCHPQLLSLPAAQQIEESAKLDYLTGELLPTLLEEGRRILLFSQFTSMLALIEAHLETEKIPFLKLTGQTQDRASLVKKFQTGEIPIFLISLKAGGTGLNLTTADTVIHYDPWWNPAAENQATDRAHRIGQSKPVFVHKLVCRGTIEDRILDLQKHKAALVEALLSEETTQLKIDAETLSHLLSPLD
jgi:superfamily II DNA or RNA helicase